LTTVVDLSELRRLVFNELYAAGFKVIGGKLVVPGGDTKDTIRSLHNTQRVRVLDKSADFIRDWEDRLLPFFADGHEIDPQRITPVVRMLDTNSDSYKEDNALFRFASLHWSVPVSQGYGRRKRFLVFDDHNEKLLGIFALGDPVFNLGARDRHIGWDQVQRQQRLYNVFDAFVLGAVEPYRKLIAGKLVALCTVSNEVVDQLEQEYTGKTTVILGVEKIPRPVLITTTSSLGRSSTYNRITFQGHKVFHDVGYTEGFGHFQFSDDLFERLVELVEDDEGFRGSTYGQGPNWKIRTIRRALDRLDMGGDMLKHGIRRQVYLAPLSVGWRAFLRGETDRIEPFSRPLEEVGDYFQKRWAVSRAERRPEYRLFSREAMRLTPDLPMRRQDRLF